MVISFLRNVWYGNRSLGQTWWFWNCFFGNFVVGGIGGLLVIPSISEQMQSAYPLLLYVVAVIIPYTIWISVGSWRSATNHPSRWSDVVKALVVASIPLNIVSWVSEWSEVGLPL